MLIGVDLDHTIIDYSDLFYKEALAQKWIEKSHSKNKLEVKNTLKTNYSEVYWQRLQSIIYGEKIAFAKPFSFIDSFFSSDLVLIISHKTKLSYVGEYELQKAAKTWLETQPNIKDVSIIFAESLSEKCQIINKMKCTYFIDDLPEVLAGIDSGINKILFDPENRHPFSSFYHKCSSWKEIYRHIHNG